MAETTPKSFKEWLTAFAEDANLTLTPYQQRVMDAITTDGAVLAFAPRRFGKVAGHKWLRERMDEYMALTYVPAQDMDQINDRMAINYYGHHQDSAERWFKADLEAVHGVADHPKAAQAFKIAWDHGHCYGLNSVKSFYDDVVELLK